MTREEIVPGASSSDSTASVYPSVAAPEAVSAKIDLDSTDRLAPGMMVTA